MRAGILMVMLICVASAQVPTTSDAARDRLAKVEIFAFGPVGYAGVTSLGEKDYQLIVSRPSAVADFERLLSVGNAQGKSYALVGIHALNPNHFKELSSSLRDSKVDVTIENGCIVSHESLSSVLKRVEAGEYAKEKSRK
jgi:hypothetical protein